MNTNQQYYAHKRRPPQAKRIIPWWFLNSLSLLTLGTIAITQLPDFPDFPIDITIDIKTNEQRTDIGQLPGN